jgi:hypothetical protein
VREAQDEGMFKGGGDRPSQKDKVRRVRGGRVETPITLAESGVDKHLAARAQEKHRTEGPVLGPIQRQHCKLITVNVALLNTTELSFYKISL